MALILLRRSKAFLVQHRKALAVCSGGISRCAEIQQLYFSVRAQENIAWRNISVDDSFLMHLGQGRKNL